MVELVISCIFFKFHKDWNDMQKGWSPSAKSRVPNQPFLGAPNLKYYEYMVDSAQNIMPNLYYLTQPKGAPFTNLRPDTLS